MFGLGASRTNNIMEWDKIWSINTNYIDPTACRYTAISNDRVEVKITNFDTANTSTHTEIDLHPKNKKLGKTPFYMSNSILIERSDADRLKLNEEVTLMAWGNNNNNNNIYICIYVHASHTLSLYMYVYVI